MKNKFNLPLRLGGAVLIILMFVLMDGCSEKNDNPNPNPNPPPPPATGSFRIYYTGDGGLHWGSGQDIQGSKQPVKITFSPPNTYFIITEDGLVIRSTDGGSTWHNLILPSTAGKLTSISSGGRSSFCAITDILGHIFVTRDNGDSWTSPASNVTVPLNDIRMSPEPYSFGYIVGNKGTVLNTYDDGDTWLKLAFPDSSDLFDLDYNIGNTTVIATSANLKVYVSRNGGTIWTGIYLGPNHNGDVIKVNIDTNGTDVVCFTTLGDVIYSPDAGQTWQPAIRPYGTLSVHMREMDNTSAALFAVGGEGDIWTSTDHGYTWQNVPNNSTNIFMDICFRDDSKGIIISRPNP